MKKILAAIAGSGLLLGLAACGSSSDASEDAMADTVEMPAEDAMADAPDPVADPEAAMDDSEADAMDAADAAEAMVQDEGVEAAIDDAEAATE